MPLKSRLSRTESAPENEREERGTDEPTTSPRHRTGLQRNLDRIDAMGREEEEETALDGTSGQDRESYTDTQDRESYSTQEDADEGAKTDESNADQEKVVVPQHTRTRGRPRNPTPVEGQLTIVARRSRLREIESEAAGLKKQLAALRAEHEEHTAAITAELF